MLFGEDKSLSPVREQAELRRHRPARAAAQHDLRPARAVTAAIGLGLVAIVAATRTGRCSPVGPLPGLAEPSMDGVRRGDPASGVRARRRLRGRGWSACADRVGSSGTERRRSPSRRLSACPARSSPATGTASGAADRQPATRRGTSRPTARRPVAAAAPRDASRPTQPRRQRRRRLRARSPRPRRSQAAGSHRLRQPAKSGATAKPSPRRAEGEIAHATKRRRAAAATSAAAP